MSARSSANERGAFGSTSIDEFLTPLARLDRDDLERRVETFADVEFAGLDLHAARFDLGHVEKIVDEAQEMRARRMDVGRVFRIARRADGCRTLPWR